jgi:hypothetical protein
MKIKHDRVRLGAVLILFGVGTFFITKNVTQAIRVSAQSKAFPFTLVQSITNESGLAGCGKV